MRHLLKGLSLATLVIATSGCHFWRHDRADAAAAPAATPTPTSVAPSAEGNAATDSVQREFPASYAGRVPCADCAGIDTRLNLFGDGVYFLREAYVGRSDGGAAEIDVGRWSRVGEPARIELHGGRATPLLLAPQEDGSLRLLDTQGQPIVSEHNYALARDAEFQPLFPNLPMRGELLVEGERTHFRDCLTGRDLEVADEADAPALRAAYAAASLPAGARILATVQGQWLRRNGIEQLQVVRFRKIWPGETCGPSYSDAPIEGSNWKLTWIDGAEVSGDDTPQAASLVLDAQAQRASGSSGCNRFTMGYSREDAAVRFAPGALTRMACPAAAMALESVYMKVLGKAAKAQVDGHQLTLHDADGNVLARFDAVPFPEQ